MPSAGEALFALAFIGGLVEGLSLVLGGVVVAVRWVVRAVRSGRSVAGLWHRLVARF